MQNPKVLLNVSHLIINHEEAIENIFGRVVYKKERNV